MMSPAHPSGPPNEADTALTHRRKNGCPSDGQLPNERDSPGLQVQ